MSEIILRSIRFLFRKAGFNFNDQISSLQTSHISHLSVEQSNTFFIDAIQSGKPFLLSRLGAVESKCLLNYIQVSTSAKGGKQKLMSYFKGHKSTWDDSVKLDAYNLAGVFPNSDEAMADFSVEYLECLKTVDGIGIWGFVPGENYLIGENCPDAVRYDPGVLDPFLVANPWTAYLHKKKVLIVHPFAETIEKQYKIRHLLFADPQVLPSFQLRTLKTVQSIAGNNTGFSDWNTALISMKKDIDRMDFDIALVSGGSYGLPISAYIKSKGKCAIHMGGSLQILFGIKGKRWDAIPATSSLYNEWWVRPATNETVINKEQVEDGCYW